MISEPHTKQSLLQQIFGFSAFRPHQEAVVDAVLARRDAFIVMPTGGGKSLCYQLPALLMDGTCIVVSPLISLMKDQVDAARLSGIQAAFLNSTLHPKERAEVEQDLMSGRLDLLYISPERFGLPEFRARLREAPISFFAVDEAHCVSEWGHDFRPDYLELSAIVAEFPNHPVTAFTATATPRVQDDIIRRLTLRDPLCIRASFNRPNLYYRVVPKQNPSRQILDFVQARPKEPGIIYRTTRKNVEQTAEQLQKNDIRALPYHAGLDESVRTQNQEAFNRDEVDVIVATVAFGMGIDKSNVRFILHADLPKNMESYYQETGRSGRDGDPAECLLLFSPGDIPTIRHFIEQVEDEEERKHLNRNLQRMVNYSSVNACRRRQILDYFGESLNQASEERCCDVCSGDVQSEEATKEAQMLLSAIKRTGERFGINHIVDIVLGNATAQIEQYRHHQLPTFGVGDDLDRRHLRNVLDNLIAQGLVIQEPGRFPTLSLGPGAQDVLFQGKPVSVLHVPRPTRRSRKRKQATAFDGDADPDLFETLRTLRKSLADAQGVPPYVVFSDRTLHEMAARQPSDEEDMLTVSGVGETKLARYGEPFLKAIRDFVTTG